MSATISSERAAILRAGAAAARQGVSRSANPHPIDGEDWINWMAGFDHQTVWLEQGRGPYDPFADGALVPA